MDGADSSQNTGHNDNNENIDPLPSLSPSNIPSSSISSPSSLLKLTKSELEAEMKNMSNLTRIRLSLSNQQEFTGNSSFDQSSFLDNPHSSSIIPSSTARIDATQLNKSRHLRTSIVDNVIQDHFYRPKSSLMLNSSFPSSSSSSISSNLSFPSTEEERIGNLEKHLGIIHPIHNNNFNVIDTASTSQNIKNPPIDSFLIQRIKILEDKILKIEQNYPQIAMREFNYNERTGSEWNSNNSKLDSRINNGHSNNSNSPFNIDNGSIYERERERERLSCSIPFQSAIGVNYSIPSPLSFHLPHFSSLSQSPSSNSNSTSINKKKKKKISVNLKINNSKSQQIQEIREKMKRLKNKLTS